MFLEPGSYRRYRHARLLRRGWMSVLCIACANLGNQTAFAQLSPGYSSPRKSEQQAAGPQNLAFADNSAAPTGGEITDSGKPNDPNRPDRSPNDSAEIQRVQMGQSCSAIAIRPDDLPNTNLTIHANLRRYPSGRVVWSDSKTLAPSQNQVDFQWEAPDRPGVYQLDLTAHARGEHSRWWPKKDDASQHNLESRSYIVGTGDHDSSGDASPSEIANQNAANPNAANSNAADPSVINQHTAPEDISAHPADQWTLLQRIDLSVASHKFAEAWQTFRQNFSSNSWFDIAVGRPGNEATANPSGTDPGDLATPPANSQPIVLNHKLRPGSADLGACFVLPAGQAYRCDLPSGDARRPHRLEIQFDPSKPVHLSLQWFLDGNDQPLFSRRVDYVPGVDRSPRWALRRFVYRLAEDCHLKVVNLDRQQSVNLSSIEIASKDPSKSITRPTPSDANIATDASPDRRFDLWIDGLSWNQILASNLDNADPQNRGQTWSPATTLAGHVEPFIANLRLHESIWHPDRVWIQCPLRSCQIDPLRLATAVELVNRTFPKVRFVYRETEQPHRAIEHLGRSIGELQGDLGSAQTLDQQPLIDHRHPQTISVCFADQDAADFVVVEQDSNDRLPSLSIFDHSHIVQKTKWNISGANNGSSRYATAAIDSEPWNRSIAAWRQWSAADVTQIDSVDQSNQTAAIFVNEKGHLAILNRAPWRSKIHLTWTVKPTKPPSIVGNGVIEQCRRSTCRLDIAPAGLVVIPSTTAVRSWSATIAGGIETVEAIKTRVTHVVERVGRLSVPPLEDDLWRGDFSLTRHLDVPHVSTSHSLASDVLGIQSASSQLLTSGSPENRQANQVVSASADVANPFNVIDLSPWLHAQHPEGCVVAAYDETNVPSDRAALDAADTLGSGESFDSTSRCVEMRSMPNQNGKTWLVSPTFEPDQDGRLAISLRCRAIESFGPSAEDDPHRSDASSPLRNHPSSNTILIRVSLEGIENGVPIRLSKEIEVAVQDGWRNYPMVLETSGWKPDRVESLRTTIDLLSPGIIRIDDVRVHRRFAATAQQESLQKLAFLAVQGFKRANLTQSSHLLSNVHVDELLFRPEYQTNATFTGRSTDKADDADNARLSTQAARQPRSLPPMAEQASDIESATPLEKNDPHPSVSKKWKNWWPQSLRF